MRLNNQAFFATGVLLLLMSATATSGQSSTAPKSDDEPVRQKPDTPADVLSSEEWRRVDVAVNRALTWLAAGQRPDGSFPTLDSGQPAVTCLCTMAFMAHGHMGGEGKYGKQLERATEYVIHCQKANGLVTLVGPDGPEIARNIDHDVGETAAYNHAISSLMLSEVYGSNKGDRSARLKKTISNSITATLKMQRWPKERSIDRGGWRYLDDFNEQDSDLSITGWELMFLRSARNAGFDVPNQSIDDAVRYVRRTFSDRYGAFGYIADKYDFRSRGMAGAGILALAHAGLHGTPEAVRSGDWLLPLNFDNYNAVERFTQKGWYNDRYHYGLFLCCQAMYQLGGEYWEKFYPRAVHTVLANQQPDGSWAPESHFHDAQFGNAYTTALVVLCLGAPNQLLPIFQR
jgi:hypothetical protein